MDGRLDKPFWQHAPWTDDFVDIQGEHMSQPPYRTRAKMLWDDACLYLGAELEEPHVWGTLTEHDSVIFQDNDFEVFLDPDGDHHLYVELEINALNTTWDLLLVRPYRDGGPPVDGFELHGLRTAVHVDGTLNDPGDTDLAWSVEIAIPWKALAQVAGRPCPPHPGDQWRINFSRVQWQLDVLDGRYVKRPNLPEDNWVWSPQYAIDMHRPEHWGVVQFEIAPADPKPLADWPIRQALVEAYHRIREFQKREGRLPTDAAEADLQKEIAFRQAGSLWLAELGPWTIDHESRLRAR